MRPFWLFVFVPVIALAQAAAPTEFPSDSMPLTPDALKERVTGKTFTFKPLIGMWFAFSTKRTTPSSTLATLVTQGNGGWRDRPFATSGKSFQEAARSIEASATVSVSSASVRVKWWCISQSESQAFMLNV